MTTTGDTTSNVLASTERCTVPHLRAAIADHFAGRSSPAAEAALRAHLPGCWDCDARYRRHLLLARLDPRAVPAEERLARGLGFRVEGRRRLGTGGWTVALAVPVAALLLLAVLPRGVRPGQTHSVTSGSGPDEFAARGAARGPSSFWAYRLGPDGTPRLAARTIAPTDELAFAYSNAGGRPFLMIFGVDEHRHLYWFHPGWSGASPVPPPLSAQAGPGPYELPEAIRQPLAAGRLRVFAAFADRPLDPKAVEDAVRAAADGDPSRALSTDGVAVMQRIFEVIP